MRGVLDTSVFIASEQGRRIDADRLPAEAAVSIFTVAELSLGVHLAADEVTRAVRLRTVAALQRSYAALPVDEDVASAFAALVAIARRNGLRPTVQDAWIAATARAHGVAVFTQDADFDELAVDVVRV